MILKFSLSLSLALSRTPTLKGKDFLIKTKKGKQKCNEILKGKEQKFFGESDVMMR